MFLIKNLLKSIKLTVHFLLTIYNGRFYKSISFHFQSELNDEAIWEVKDYNSRPRDMINGVLSRIQKKEIVIDNEELLIILKATLDLSVYFKDKLVESNQIDYLIDAVIPFVDKFKDNLNLLEPFLADPELANTFEK